MSGEPQKRNGILLKGIGGFYYVKTADGVLECKAKGIFRKQGITPLAGDTVSVEGNGEDLVICEIAARRNVFQRPPVANVDNFFLVTSAIDPKPNLLLLDKLTAIAYQQNARPVLVITKTDLEQADALAKTYEAAGFYVIDVRRDSNAAMEQIAEICTENVSVFVGNSGVGKSTLLNELCPGLALETAETSKKLGRGKHTTRAVELFAFCGGYVVDTPGFSAMEFAHSATIAKESLTACFPDIERFADGCYFTGCSHTVEKGCGVLQALQNGDISKSRHESYCILYEEAAAQKSWESPVAKK